jgi:hypothetical protein
VTRWTTLEPIRAGTLHVPVRRVASTLECGLRTSWVDGMTDDGEEFNLCSGAGLGSRWLTFTIAGRDYCVDVEDVLKQFLEFDATGKALSQ